MTDELPVCGHCNSILRIDTVLIGIERSGQLITIAATHEGCLSEWDLIVRDGEVYHLHDGEEIALGFSVTA